MKRKICPSGIEGWTGPLQQNYALFEEFERHCETYGLHTRLGYKTPEDAWKANPTIQGSVNPSDFSRVPRKRKRSVRMSEQQRRDEKNGLYGGTEDVAN